MSSVVDTAAVADERKDAVDTQGGEDKGVLELLGRLVDDKERKANEYEVPVATTMFGGAGVDDERMANPYDVPRPATLATTRFEEGSIKNEKL